VLLSEFVDQQNPQIQVDIEFLAKGLYQVIFRTEKGMKYLPLIKE
jgi:hypothetical protein